MWNSLDIVKLIISALTPIIGGIIAWRLAKIRTELNNRQWTNQKVIEKRLDFYERVLPALNDMYCFFTFVGNWKELTPPEIIQKKRFLDKQFHVFAHLFSQNIIKEYDTFIHSCFATHTGWAQDAKIMTEFEQRKVLKNWDDQWDQLFVPEMTTPKSSFKEHYQKLVKAIRGDLGIIEP